MTEPSQSQTRAVGLGLPDYKLRLHINDFRHPGAKAFLSLIPDLECVLESALWVIKKSLYTAPSSRNDKKGALRPFPTFYPSFPPTRSVTILLRHGSDIRHLAHTKSTELDEYHKEIHFSLSDIHRTSTRLAIDPAFELRGVLTHELAHCYQHLAHHLAHLHPNDLRPPLGLIEGIADFVRLRAGLAPPHWKRPVSARDRPEQWDQGYHPTAYFLAWLEDVRIGTGAVGLVNDRLLRQGYCAQDKERDEGGESCKKDFWESLFGERIEVLWEEYGVYLDQFGGLIEKKVSAGMMGTGWEGGLLIMNER
ncbi:BSP-domain-containing protein [Aspergillus affinis]|uniref:BSP-domain-containing protein n=1 Tax=Aspergillus affinis TaxID=1070780 RepID=UPI0022FE4122|nr:BSP-domain-containing protein [Aspergillus affinis]KAI9038814.1 BSP-domain-containing protein [Aspergillus affinis]